MHHQPDRAIAEIAARQRGLITASQLAEVGVSARAINGRVANARLTRVLHGVYVVAVP
ncbi:MAG: type IV toxin-antitoxin system AbiEi family antitoxin domain-containing protein, partial [Solirubrobacteraceae bacterium]|nr:type IV toxin-antitoxin system AbiEi family antitoxin domain-containing protein [Solirubrobacteraceae bacterium]